MVDLSPLGLARPLTSHPFVLSVVFFAISVSESSSCPFALTGRFTLLSLSETGTFTERPSLSDIGTLYFCTSCILIRYAVAPGHRKKEKKDNIQTFELRWLYPIPEQPLIRVRNNKVYSIRPIPTMLTIHIKTRYDVT